jgi:hypothetical protein
MPHVVVALKIKKCRLRNYQISGSVKKFQIRNGYMQLIAFSHLVSNHRPVKCGFIKIKRANPLVQIHPSEL